MLYRNGNVRCCCQGLIVVALLAGLASLLFSETKPAQTLKGHKDAISSIVFSADGKYLA